MTDLEEYFNDVYFNEYGVAEYGAAAMTPRLHCMVDEDDSLQVYKLPEDEYVEIAITESGYRNIVALKDDDLRIIVSALQKHLGGG